MRKWYQADPLLRAAADALLRDIIAAFGWPTRLIAPLIGRYAFSALKKETARLLADTLEPFRRKKKELESRDLYVREILKRGAKKASLQAASTMEEVRNKIGLVSL